MKSVSAESRKTQPVLLLIALSAVRNAVTFKPSSLILQSHGSRRKGISAINCRASPRSQGTPSKCCSFSHSHSSTTHSPSHGKKIFSKNIIPSLSPIPPPPSPPHEKFKMAKFTGKYIYGNYGENEIAYSFFPLFQISIFPSPFVTFFNYCLFASHSLFLNFFAAFFDLVLI